MTDPERFALFADTRERIGQAFVRELTEAIIALADTIDRPTDPHAAETLACDAATAAAMLREQAPTRARRGLSSLNDLTFRLLELNQTQTRADDSSLLSLLPGRSIDLQILADELAHAIRDLLGPAYAGWLGRVDALTRVAATETRAPFGAGTLAAAAIEGLDSLCSDRALRPAMRIAVLEQLAPRLARVLLDADQWLAMRLGQAAPPALLVRPPMAGSGASQQASGLPQADANLTVTAAEPSPRAAEAMPFEPPPARPLGLTDSLAYHLDLAESLGWSPVASSVPQPPPLVRASVLARPDEFEQDAVKFARAHQVEPFGRQARQLFFAQPRRRMLQLGASPGQVAALDLVAGLFDYVCEDRRLPAAARPLMWRLQQPVAALATLDIAFLGDDTRSVRKMVESIAALAVAHSDEVARHGEAYRRLETSVRAIEVIAHALQTRSAVLSDRIRHEYRRAEQGVGTLVSRLARERDLLDVPPDRRNRRNLSRRPSRETERAVTHKLEVMLRERLARCDVPEPVQEFLQAVWLRHLRTSLLRDGEDSPSFKLAMQVVDDLLWSLDASGPGLSRRQLAQRIPPLIRTLTQGVTAIGARQEEYQPFLDALFLMHLRKMQKMPRDAQSDSQRADDLTAQVPSAESVWPTTHVMPEPFEAMDEAGAGGLDQPVTHARPTGSTERRSQETAASATDAWDASAPTVLVPEASNAPSEGDARPAVVHDEQLSSLLAAIDLNDLPQAPRRLALRPDESVDSLRVGDWLEMDGRGGELQQVKVAWINPARTVLLLVRRDDRRVISLRASELHQRFAQHKAVLIV